MAELTLVWPDWAEAGVMPLQRATAQSIVSKIFFMS
jgi:hypothetical protein